MNGFIYEKGELFCERVNLRRIRASVGTPCYVYSKAMILDNYAKLKEAFKTVNPLICYSVKANSNLAILNALVKAGSGLDIVSGGELFRARKVNCPARKIVYASVGKTQNEIDESIKYGIHMFNVESIPELIAINTRAGVLGKKVNVSLRVNPDVAPKTHKYITTGKKETKFGIDIATARELFIDRSKFPSLNLIGVHLHIGSQILSSAPFVKAITKIAKFIEQLRKEGVTVSYLNIGGGLGISYGKQRPLAAAAFAKKILEKLRKLNLKIILEPGRFIVGNAGALIADVIYVKDTPVKRFVVVDAAMNDLIRPALYDAYHRILPLTQPKKNKIEKKYARLSDIVGPVCETGDFFGKDRMSALGEGDALAVLDAGAYGFVMSSNYNSRPRVAEVLVSGNRFSVIRKRETNNDLIKGESLL